MNKIERKNLKKRLFENKETVKKVKAVRTARLNDERAQWTISAIALIVMISITIFASVKVNKNQSYAYEGVVVGAETDETVGTTEEPVMMMSMSSEAETELDPFDVIEKEFAGLQEGNVEDVVKYFGESDAFNSEVISDRTALSSLHMIDSTDNDGVYTVNVHVCTIDYQKMNEDYAVIEAEESKANNEAADDVVEENTKKRVTSNLIDNKYNVCYNIPVEVSNDGVVVSESFKQAITGGWYSGAGVTLEPVECIVNAE